MITPYALLAFTRTATPLAAPVPLGGFRLIWPTTFAAFAEVVPVPVVPVVAGVVADCVLVAEAAAGMLEVCLLEDEFPRIRIRTTTIATTTIAPTPRKIAPPSRELGRSVGRGTRARSDFGFGFGWPGSVGERSSVDAGAVLLAGALARAVPSGISGSGLLATLCSSEASTRAQARSYGDSASRSRVCSATRSGSWPSR